MRGFSVMGDLLETVPARWTNALSPRGPDKLYFCELRGLTRLPPALESFSLRNVHHVDLDTLVRTAPRLSHLGYMHLLGPGSTQYSFVPHLTALTSLDITDSDLTNTLCSSSLRSLTIGDERGESDLAINTGFQDITLSKMPTITELTIKASTLRVAPNELEAVQRLRRLTTFRVVGMLDLIPQLTNLTSLELIEWAHDFNIPNEPTPDITPLRLPPSLLDLSIHNSHGYHEDVVIDFSRSARLTSLELSACNLTAMQPIDALAALTSLQHLSIVRCNVDPDTLWHVPPSLLTLNLTHSWFEADGQNYLVNTDVDVPTLPNTRITNAFHPTDPPSDGED